MEITQRAFDALTPTELYDVARLRQDVFVVEQACPYPDLDGRDTEPTAVHVLLHLGDGAERHLAGCARVLVDEVPEKEGAAGPVWRIGRIALVRSARGQGLSTPLMEGALRVCAAAVERDVVLDAQSPLVGFYAGFGFAPDGPEFLEDGIPHTPMRRQAG
ncbi:GNAT family N-acetyltransferase [Nocardioides sp. BGMRC 2183]|nr:GNAT family N-acetyltransferase [Nocardioides sp. BGMRC 2183]